MRQQLLQVQHQANTLLCMVSCLHDGQPDQRSHFAAVQDWAVACAATQHAVQRLLQHLLCGWPAPLSSLAADRWQANHYTAENVLAVSARQVAIQNLDSKFDN